MERRKTNLYQYTIRVERALRTTEKVDIIGFRLKNVVSVVVVSSWLKSKRVLHTSNKKNPAAPRHTLRNKCTAVVVALGHWEGGTQIRWDPRLISIHPKTKSKIKQQGQTKCQRYSREVLRRSYICVFVVHCRRVFGNRT